MTTHEWLTGDSRRLDAIADRSVQLILTSPPYPMIAMWDGLFGSQDPAVAAALEQGQYFLAFQRMHLLLDAVWSECIRVLADGGFLCINIGDAVRTFDGTFQLFSNHARVIEYLSRRGCHILPDIHWRKPSNAPNKFMGSGMYPAGAYVTYEHEYILIFRKGGKRLFSGPETARRRKSACFWEERNVWYSDLWEIRGAAQKIPGAGRGRSAAYPFEIPYRLVNMYSIEGDAVLDPFAGFGTTTLACMTARRNSIGVEIDPAVTEQALANLSAAEPERLNAVIDRRIAGHLAFIDTLPAEKRAECYHNTPHGFPVRTRQETALKLDTIAAVRREGNRFFCSYE